MALSDINADHIRRAIADVVAHGVPRGRGSRKFCLVVDGRHLPPKYVVGLAHQMAVGIELTPEEFNGGAQSNELLADRGFRDIRECSCGGTTTSPTRKSAAAPEPTATTAAGSTSATVTRKARTFRVALVLPRLRAKDVSRVTDPKRYRDRGIDLVLFPEAWLRGETDPNHKLLRSLARDAAVEVVAGLSHAGEQKLLRFPASGASPTPVYTKHSTSKRVAFGDAAWSADERLPVVRIRDVNVGFTICHDHYLGLLQRRLGAGGAEVWLNPSFDLVKDEKWANILRLRAVENGFAALCTLHADGDERAHPFGFTRSGVELAGQESSSSAPGVPLQLCRESDGIYIVDVPLDAAPARDALEEMEPNRKRTGARTGKNQRLVPVGMRSGRAWVESAARKITFGHPVSVGADRLMFFAIDGDELLRPELFWQAIDRAHLAGARPVFWNHWQTLPTDTDRLVSLMLGRSLECMAPVVLSDAAGIHEVTEVANASKVLRRVDLGTVPTAVATIDIDKALGWHNAFKMASSCIPAADRARARERYLSLGR